MESVEVTHICMWTHEVSYLSCLLLSSTCVLNSLLLAQAFTGSWVMRAMETVLLPPSAAAKMARTS